MGAGCIVAAGAVDSGSVIDGLENIFLAHRYQINDVLEKGPVSTICRAVNRMTSKTYIIKSVDVRRYKASGFTTQDLDREIAICAELKHPYFMQLKDVVMGDDTVHLVFEYVEGSDICFEIVKRAAAGFVYSEAVASHYTRQLMEALTFIHSKKIIHRDIRPHNIVLATVDNNAPLKLRGFGVAAQLAPDENSAKLPRVGIPQFMAPETVSGDPIGTSSDIWSAGVVLYLLLSGRLPFNGTSSHVYESISEGKYSLQGSPWNYISDDAKDLLTRLLTVDPSKRLSAEKALEHRWLADKTCPRRQHLNETVESIRCFNLRRKLKSKVIAAVNNPRWNKFPISSFISADSMPGGDACEADYGSRFENNDAVIRFPKDTAGVEKVLASLDLISALSDPAEPDSALKEALEEEDFKQAITVRIANGNLPSLATGRKMPPPPPPRDPSNIPLRIPPPPISSIRAASPTVTFFMDVQLYDRISTSKVRPIGINLNSEQQLSEAKSEVSTLISPSAEALELSRILENVHLRAILQANDIVIEEVYTPSSQMEPNEFIVRPDSGTGIPPGIAHPAVVPPGAAHSPRGVPLSAAGSSKTSTPVDAGGSQTGTLPFSKTNGFVSRSAMSEQMPSTSSVMPPVEQLSTLPRPQNLLTRDPQPLFADDDDDLMTNVVSRIRVIQFTKDTEEPMGITLKITEDNRCLVARIMHGGMIHRQATLHVGDEIREINGVSVANQSVETLQKMLREARGQVTFKIVPSYRSAPPACEIYFDYDPSQDDLIPCSQAGVPFKTGDVLQVISKDDHNWWQARFVAQFPAFGSASSNSSQASTAVVAGSPTAVQNVVAGLIPSPELQEWRTACLAMERAKDGTHCLWFNKKKKYYTTKYLRKHSDLFDQMDLVTYEEVVRLTSFRRKTLVLLGAHGVGRRHIKNTLIHRHPQRFAYPIPHTTRPPRKDEVDGKHYYFVSNDQMLTDIQNSEYLEYGTHEECMYGTKLETIRAIHRQGKMAILDVEPQALKVLRTAEYSPFVVFIAAPDLQGLQDPDGSLERLGKESEILRQAFGHLFDFVICNNDIDETIRQIETIVEKLNAIPQWVPVSWVY
uniref:Peripheral plasma membrane protein CASK n=1 Tax=Panagrolaimus sp. JU765 TaxID=591449 RepID=A0AC34QGE1_9BILA